MYEVALLFHSYLRWIVLALGVISLAASLTGWLGGRPWRASDEGRHQGFLMALDVQMLIGLALWVVLSPTVKTFVKNMDTAMKDSVLRFWGMEHAMTMLLAVVAAHVGRSMSKRREGPERHKPMAIGMIVFFLFVLAAFPWPGAEHGRPLFRGMP